MKISESRKTMCGIMRSASLSTLGISSWLLLCSAFQIWLWWRYRRWNFISVRVNPLFSISFLVWIDINLIVNERMLAFFAAHINHPRFGEEVALCYYEVCYIPYPKCSSAHARLRRRKCELSRINSTCTELWKSWTCFNQFLSILCLSLSFWLVSSHFRRTSHMWNSALRFQNFCLWLEPFCWKTQSSKAIRFLLFVCEWGPPLIKAVGACNKPQFHLYDSPGRWRFWNSDSFCHSIYREGMGVNSRFTGLFAAEACQKGCWFSICLSERTVKAIPWCDCFQSTIRSWLQFWWSRRGYVDQNSSFGSFSEEEENFIQYRKVFFDHISSRDSH